MQVERLLNKCDGSNNVYVMYRSALHCIACNTNLVAAVCRWMHACTINHACAVSTWFELGSIHAFICIIKSGIKMLQKSEGKVMYMHVGSNHKKDLGKIDS